MIFTKKNLILAMLLLIFFAGALWLFLQTTLDIVGEKIFFANEVDGISKNYLNRPTLEKIQKDIEIEGEKVNQIFKAAFIEESSEADFKEFLLSLAGQKVEPKINFGLRQKVKQSDYFKVPVEIVLQSDFYSVFQYLYDLEKSDYYFEIASIKISNLTSENQTESNVKATLSGYFYSF